METIINCLQYARCQELGLSSTTVENAYNQLMVEGYIQYSPERLLCANLDHSLINVGTLLLKIQNVNTRVVIFLTRNFNFGDWRKIYNRIMRDFKQRLLVKVITERQNFEKP